mmetsp:Transcript_32073/g.107981  ORF Transcript_32073/g.107981 Transcript_32073/m.107981 type:complete len:274 (+) Transcript_32073:666-1487(+)
MRHVEAGDGADGVRRVGDALHVEQSAGIVLQRPDEHHGQRRTRSFNRGDDGVRANVAVADAGDAAEDVDAHNLRGAVAVALQRRLHRVVVGRERARLDEDLVPLRSRLVKRRQQHVQVHRRRVHQRHLERRVVGADDARRRIARPLFNVDPRHTGALGHKVALDAVRGPAVQVLEDGRAHARRLQAQRVAAEVRHLISVLRLGLEEHGAVLGERVFRVELRRVLLSRQFLARNAIEHHAAASRGARSDRTRASSSAAVAGGAHARRKSSPAVR